jgi:hypothetical protein
MVLTLHHVPLEIKENTQHSDGGTAYRQPKGERIGEYPARGVLVHILHSPFSISVLPYPSVTMSSASIVKEKWLQMVDNVPATQARESNCGRDVTVGGRDRG